MARSWQAAADEILSIRFVLPALWSPETALTSVNVCHDSVGVVWCMRVLVATLACVISRVNAYAVATSGGDARHDASLSRMLSITVIRSFVAVAGRDRPAVAA